MFGGGPPIQLMWSKTFDPEKPQVQRDVQWQRIIGYFKPYAKLQTIVFICVLANSIVSLAPALCTMRLIDRAIPHKDLQLVAIYVGGMVAAAIGSSLLSVAQTYCSATIGEGVARDLRASLVAHLQKLPIAFFKETKIGEIMNRVSNDVDSISNVFSGTLVSIITNVLLIATTLVAIFSINWRLALVSVAVIPLMVVPLWPVGRQLYRIRKLTRKKRDEAESLTQETLSISGIALVKSFAKEGYERKRYFDVQTSLMGLEIKLVMANRWFLALLTAMVVIGPALVWFFGGWLAIRGGLTVGTIVSFVVLLNRLYGPASDLAGVQVQIVSALAVFERIFEYLDLKEEEQVDRPDAIEIENVQGEITFENVSFSYDGGDSALEDISFEVVPGQMVAFIGPSGAGKTTITHLVSRFYNPQSGRICLDGVDIHNIRLPSLRRNIGIVMQETYLFHDTIGNNLRYANEHATDEQLIEAAKAANIHDYISSLPEKYDTVVGERGHKLSGGERQRLAIARVLLKDPRILILDEATSSLDSDNEALIQAALRPLMQGRTSLVIAHRLSTILAADAIFVIEGGKLVEQGTHAVLLKRGQAYAKAYRQQFKNLNISAT
jgi:ATP-binding cassette, subfamily B, bacterial